MLDVEEDLLLLPAVGGGSERIFTPEKESSYNPFENLLCFQIDISQIQGGASGQIVG